MSGPLRHRVRPAMCKSCIMRQDNPCGLRPGRLAEIQAYLIRGTAHKCHSPGPSGRINELACRGGRDYQLTIWHRMGILPEPTDSALEAAMRALGFPDLD